MARYRKIYIDTRHRNLNESLSTSDFVIDLPETQETGANTKLYLHELSLPNTIYPIEENVNNRLYLTLGGTTGGAPVYYFIVAPDKGSYVGSELATELQNKLNTATNGTDGNNDYFSCSYSLKTNTITISCNYVAYYYVIHTDKELQTNYGFSVDYDRSHTMSINNVLGNTVEKINYAPTPFVSGFVNLLPMKNIYLTSDSLTNGNQLAPYGVARVLKKIPITAGFGNVIYDNEILMNDANDVSMRHLRRLHFKYVDAYGKTVDLHGADSSFSLTFVET